MAALTVSTALKSRSSRNFPRTGAKMEGDDEERFQEMCDELYQQEQEQEAAEEAEAEAQAQADAEAEADDESRR